MDECQRCLGTTAPSVGISRALRRPRDNAIWLISPSKQHDSHKLEELELLHTSSVGIPGKKEHTLYIMYLSTPDFGSSHLDRHGFAAGSNEDFISSYHLPRPRQHLGYLLTDSP
jgi:hypothetical protein